MYLELWWFLTVPVFFAIGWITSRWDRKKNRGRKQTRLNDLEKLVLFLTEDNHNVAIKLLQGIIKDYERSFYLQKALGILFRRCGLFDRSIDIHAALLSVRKIEPSLKDSTLIELAKDYVGAGLYDRAYQALELVEGEDYKIQVLQLRLRINQRLKQWKLALKTLEDLENYKEIKLQNLRIHFFCELIENGNVDYKEKLLEINSNHKRVKHLMLNQKTFPSDGGVFICNFCAAKFDDFFWKCHLCETWDSCEQLSCEKH